MESMFPFFLHVSHYAEQKKILLSSISCQRRSSYFVATHTSLDWGHHSPKLHFFSQSSYSDDNILCITCTTVKHMSYLTTQSGGFIINFTISTTAMISVHWCTCFAKSVAIACELCTIAFCHCWFILLTNSEK